MGRFVAVGKGSGRRPEDQEKLDDNWEKAFGSKKPVETMRYLTDPESKKLIPEYMWDQYGIRPPPPAELHYVQKDYEDYVSTVSDKVISGRRQHRYEMETNGTRVYEGRESEQRAADSHNAQEEKKFDKVLDNSLKETLNDIKYQNNPPAGEKISWTF